MSSRVVSLSVAMFTAAEIAAAQVIPIQTVPLVPADQFDIFPSLGLAMGGVSIALADTLHDPFVNPATGARLRTAHLLGSPTFYGVSDDAGAGRTLPLALFTAARPVASLRNSAPPIMLCDPCDQLICSASWCVLSF